MAPRGMRYGFAATVIEHSGDRLRTLLSTGSPGSAETAVPRLHLVVGFGFPCGPGAIVLATRALTSTTRAEGLPCGYLLRDRTRGRGDGLLVWLPGGETYKRRRIRVLAGGS